MLVFESRGVTIPLIEEAKEVFYESMRDLIPLFPEGQKLPILKGNDSHPYFMLYSVNGPAVLTDASHAIYHAPKGFYQYEYNKPELVVQMAHPGAVQICWGQWPKKGEVNNPKAYPQEPAPNWGQLCAGYLILVPEYLEHSENKSSEKCRHFLIAGKQEVEKQLKEWGITDLGIEGLL